LLTLVLAGRTSASQRLRKVMEPLSSERFRADCGHRNAGSTWPLTTASNVLLTSP